MEFSAGKLPRSTAAQTNLSPWLLCCLRACSPAQNLTVIGGTSAQKQLTACIEQSQLKIWTDCRT